MGCYQTNPGIFHCPIHPELTQAALHLLPRGRAWQTNEGGPAPTSVIYRYWQSITEPLWFLHSRLCALREEYFCKTHVETDDLWLADYGLPDACDPFPDLCTKVAAIGGTRCEYYALMALRLGWAIDCVEEECSQRIGCSEFGLMRYGTGPRTGVLIVRVDKDSSPSYNRSLRSPEFGCFEFGEVPPCQTAIDGLKCLLERIIPAHLRIEYVIY